METYSNYFIVDLFTYFHFLPFFLKHSYTYHFYTVIHYTNYPALYKILHYTFCTDLPLHPGHTFFL